MSKRKQVASLAGVSEATVSRVLNGIGPVKENTRKRVLQAAKELDYQVNAVASSFARGRSGNLGVVLPRVPKVGLFSTYYFSEILNGIADAVDAQQYGLLLLYRDPTEIYDYLKLFQTQRIDGCLILGASALPSEQQSIEKLALARVPCCMIDQEQPGQEISKVVVDHKEGSRQAVLHLLEQSNRRIAFLNGSPQYSASRLRLEGYKAALTEKGVEFNPDIVFQGNYSRTSGYQQAYDIAGRLDQLDAIAVANDRMAIGLIQGLREQGVTLPKQLPLVGYDDSDMARLLEMPLTTVRVPFYQMGYLAAQSLLERIPAWKSNEDVFSKTLKTELIVRDSSYR